MMTTIYHAPTPFVRSTIAGILAALGAVVGKVSLPSSLFSLSAPRPPLPLTATPFPPNASFHHHQLALDDSSPLVEIIRPLFCPLPEGNTTLPLCFWVSSRKDYHIWLLRQNRITGATLPAFSFSSCDHHHHYLLILPPPPSPPLGDQSTPWYPLPPHDGHQCHDDVILHP